MQIVDEFPLVISGVDTSRLRQQLLDNPQLWNSVSLRKTYPGTPHAEMDDIWVRYNDISKFNSLYPAAFNEEHVPVNYPAWHLLDAVQDIIFSLMAHERGEMLGAVLITKIPPGCKIYPHIDRSWHVDYFEKYYLSLESSPGARFWCRPADGPAQYLEPEVGNIHLFDNRKLHWVDNDSKTDRITLIICIRTAKYGRYKNYDKS